MRKLSLLFQEVDLETLCQENAGRIVIDTDLYFLVKTVRPCGEWYLFANLSHYRIVLGLNHHQGKIIIFNEVSACSVISFQWDAPVPAKLVLLFQGYLNLDIFGEPETDLLWCYEVSSFSDTSGEIEKTNNYKVMSEKNRDGNQPFFTYIKSFGRLRLGF